MKFISLTKPSVSDKQIAINPMMIVALEPTPTGKTCVHVFNHQSWTVEETIEEIQNKIKASEGYVIINHDVKNK